MSNNNSYSVKAINLCQVSHHDLAWVEGTFNAEVKYVNNEINLALKSINENNQATWSHELIVFIREYLKEHPERYDELAERLQEGRFEIGAGYSSPYTSAIPSEMLVRQFICGKKWIDDTFPGYHADVYYNTDVPGLTAQMPQILAKSEVEYLYASRSWSFPNFDKTEIKKWRAPDGSEIKTLFLNHYSDTFINFNNEYLLSQLHNYIEHMDKQNLGDEMPMVYSADSILTKDLSENFEVWNSYAEENGLPKIRYETVQAALKKVFAEGTDFSGDTLEGDWPNLWFYESNPASYEGYKQHKEAERLLRAAEVLSVVRAVIAGSFEQYPSEDIKHAWMALELVCHGFAPQGAIDDFLASYQNAYDIAKNLYEGQLQWLIAQVATRNIGMPIVIYNNLSWTRTDTVVLEKPVSLEEAFLVLTTDGEEVPYQITRDGNILFVAQDIPSMGYAVYYLVSSSISNVDTNIRTPWTKSCENDFYRITPGKNGTLSSVFDKQVKRELFDCSKFSIGQIMNFQYDGMGAGEHFKIWQPHSPKEAELTKDWICLENGPVRTVFEASVAQGEGTATVVISLYHKMKRLDFDIILEGFGEIPQNQVRMMFPIAMDSMYTADGLIDNSSVKVSFEIPFGISVVGDEVLPKFSHFNPNIGDPNDVGFSNNASVKDLEDNESISSIRPRNVQNWIRAEDRDFYVNISSYNLGWDYQDATESPVRTPVLQPVMLSVSKSCHWGFGHWIQPGAHHYHFSLTSGASEQAMEGNRAGIAANNPLDARVQYDKAVDAALPEKYSAFAVSAENVMITAVKKAEDYSDKIVLRSFDMQGKNAENMTVTLHAGTAIVDAKAVNLIEHETGLSYHTHENSMDMTVTPWSIETVMITIA